MSSTSTSSSSYSALSGNRMSGSSLMSGLDTESIVKAMASNTKSRINKQQQKIDSLTWKQEGYRTIINKIADFKDKYFNSLNTKTNLSSSSLMSKYKTTSSNPLVTATSSSSAIATTYSISSIQQLAKSAKITSDFGTGKLSNGINLDFSGAVSGTTYNVKLTLDGAAKDITFTAGADASATSANFEAAVHSKFGTDFAMSNGSLTYNLSDGVKHTFTISKSDLDSTSKLQIASMESIGLPDGGSSNVSTGAALSTINFSTPLSGGSYSFTINGAEFTFDDSATIKEIINEVNNSKEANVTIALDSLAQKFTITSDVDGASSSIDVKQTCGNLLTSMFGSQFVEGDELGTKSLLAKSVTGTATTAADLNDYKNTKISVTVNGVTKEIGLWGYDNNGNKYDYKTTSTTTKNYDGSTTTTTVTAASKAVSSLNNELTRQFGDDAPSFKYDENTQKITLSAGSSGDVMAVKPLSTDANSDDLLNDLGFGSGATNEITSSSVVSDLMGSNFTAGTITVGTQTISINSSTTMGDIETALGSCGTIDYTAGIIRVNSQVSAGTTDGQALVSALFGGEYADITGYTGTTDGVSSTAVTSTGQNAILTINGTTLSNASNSVVVNGTTINIGNLTTKTDGSVDLSAGAITVTTTRDMSSAKEAVVSFIEDYNKLVDELYTEIETKRPTSDGTINGTKYDPLTEEQEEEMSDDQIDDWNEKAKKGLLYSDSSISNFLSSIRSALTTLSPSGFSIFDMGIDVSSTTSDHGKITIEDESAFDTAFETYADEIKELFTGNDGLSKNVTSAIDSAVSTSRTSGYGSLIRAAGMESTVSATDNEITNLITEYQKTLSTLKTRYSSELERYWSKFTALETSMAKYNSYSSLFTTSTT